MIATHYKLIAIAAMLGLAGCSGIQRDPPL